MAEDGKMMVVAVKAVSGDKRVFEASVPLPLFDARIQHNSPDIPSEYDVTADGKRFLINTAGRAGAGSTPPLNVVVNWLAERK